MLASIQYTKIQDDANLSRTGGIIIKGQTRNERQPVHMMLAVDTSGSMEMENKLASVRRSITLLLELLSPEDRLSLVTFADDSKTFLNRVVPTPEERIATLYRVGALQAEGSTNMSAGLLEARGLVEPPDSGRKQGLILLTDGHANIGVHSEEGLIEILKRIQAESPGLSLTTVAYGVDHNAEMLTNLAKAGGGAYNVVRNLEDVATVFGDILGGLVSVSAQKVEVQLPPGANAMTSFRTEKDSSGMVSVYVGDLYADSEVTILFESAPSMGAIRIKGTDMSTLNQLDLVIEPTVLRSLEDIPVSLIMAEYRQKVVKVLNLLRTATATLLIRGENSIRAEAEALVKQIQDDDRISTHPLKPMLIEDLEQALRISRSGHHLTQNETVEMAQHSAYLGMARGLRTVTSQVPPHGPQGRVRRSARIQRQMAVGSLAPDEVGSATHDVSPPPSPRLAPMMTSPFANRIQTQMASVMRTMSSQDPDSQPHP
jgi:Mg-chelatase subunit ChlD